MTHATPATTNKRWTLGVATLLVAATAISLSPGVPKVWAPFPLPLFVLAWILGPLVFLAPASVFLLWSKQLFRGEPRVPYRSLGTVVVLSGLSIWYFLSAWSDGAMRHGHTYIVTVAIVNAGFVAGLAAVAIWSYRKPMFASSLLFHFLLFIWLAWYAFPLLRVGP